MEKKDRPQLSVLLDADLLHQLKVAVAIDRKTITEVVRDLLQGYVNQPR